MELMRAEAGLRQGIAGVVGIGEEGEGIVEGWDLMCCRSTLGIVVAARGFVGVA